MKIFKPDLSGIRGESENIMKVLYSADTNYTRYYIVEDWDNLKAAVINWDLSKEEEKELIQNFVSGNIDFNSYEWVEYETAYKIKGCWKCLEKLA